MCILATKEQLDELLTNCTNPQDFSILHVDHTFNLGNIYVCHSIGLFVQWLCISTLKNPLMFVGPLLIYHTMEHTSYHGFFSQLLRQLPEFCHVKAIGSDGETALCKAIKATLPGAVHWRCIMLTSRFIIITISQILMPMQCKVQLQTQPETPPIVHYAPTVPGPSTSTPVLTSTRNQSFSLKMLTPNIKICVWCRLGYQPRAPPYDICIVHPETRQIWNQATGCILTVGTNAHYHVGIDSIKLRFLDFCPYHNLSSPAFCVRSYCQIHSTRPNCTRVGNLFYNIIHTFTVTTLLNAVLCLHKA